MTGEDARARISGGQSATKPWGSLRVLVVLHHAGKVSSNSHAGDDTACILAVRSNQRALRVLKHIPVQPRIKHCANMAIVPMTAGSNDDCLFRADEDRGSALLGVAVLPEAFQAHACVVVEPC